MGWLIILLLPVVLISGLLYFVFLSLRNHIELDYHDPCYPYWENREC